MAKGQTDEEKLHRVLKSAWRAWRTADAVAKRTRAEALEARQKLSEATTRLHEVVGDATGLPPADDGQPLFDGTIAGSEDVA